MAFDTISVIKPGQDAELTELTGKPTGTIVSVTSSDGVDLYLVAYANGEKQENDYFTEKQLKSINP